MLNSCEGLPSSPKKCICQNRPSSRSSSRTFYTAIQREQTDKFKTPTAAVFAMIFVLIVQMILGSCHLVTLFVCVASIWRAGSRHLSAAARPSSAAVAAGGPASSAVAAVEQSCWISRIGHKAKSDRRSGPGRKFPGRM